MSNFKAGERVPIHELKKKSSFHICYELDGVKRSVIKTSYGSNGDFFIYPNMQTANASVVDLHGKRAISKSAEVKHPRLTVHQSGVIVGPDKIERPQEFRYPKLKTAIKDSPEGVSLGQHFLAAPGTYNELTCAQAKKGNWVTFSVSGAYVQPIIRIDAYPFTEITNLETVIKNKNYMCGFITKFFEQDYRVLILFDIEEVAKKDVMMEHKVLMPVS
jgi:hypothetical protein